MGGDIIEIVRDVIINLSCTAFGAYLGFKYAIKAENESSEKRDHEARRFLLERLSSELQKIKSNLEASWNKKDVILTYEFTSWKVMLSTGDLKLFNGMPYYNTMISLCSNIEFLIEIERNNDYIDTILDVRKSVLNQLCSEDMNMKKLLHGEEK